MLFYKTKNIYICYKILVSLPCVSTSSPLTEITKQMSNFNTNTPTNSKRSVKIEDEIPAKKMVIQSTLNSSRDPSAESNADYNLTGIF